MPPKGHSTSQQHAASHSQEMATRALEKFLPSASLFLSASTLICCALPSLFVALGAGATFVSLLGVVPQLVWFSENKGMLFTVAGLCITFTALMRVLGPRQCPTDPALAARCSRARKVSDVLLCLSATLYIVGGVFAFIAPLIWS